MKAQRATPTPVLRAESAASLALSTACCFAFCAWSNTSATRFFASGVGGYIAGRLRGGWARVHADEVFFRDTAHGLLVWAVGAVMAAVLLAWAASSAVSGAAHVAGAATEAVGAATGQAAGQVASTMGDPTAYFSDMLWRSDKPAQGDQASATAEGGESCRGLCTTAIFPPGIRPISLSSLRDGRE